MAIDLPGPGQRVTIIGRTGSGKTIAAFFQLSLQDWPYRPWVVLDFKGDEHIAQIPNQKPLSIIGEPPKEPGIYVARPLPNQIEEVNAFLWKVWAAENIGLWVDEGYMVKGMDAMRAIFIQGRSKKIGVIFATQRPVWVDKFAVSEADYYQIFNLNDKADRDVVKRFIPEWVELDEKLPKFYSWWVDVANDEATRLSPGPGPKEILEIFRERNVEPEKSETLRSGNLQFI